MRQKQWQLYVPTEQDRTDGLLHGFMLHTQARTRRGAARKFRKELETMTR